MGIGDYSIWLLSVEDNMSTENRYDENNWEHIPRRPGIYAFYLSNISLSKIGLYRDLDYSSEDLKGARKVLKARVKHALRILRKVDYFGSIAEEGRTLHLRKTLKLRAFTHYNYKFLSEIDDIPIELIPEYVDLLESSIVFQKPIYVGITTKQTLLDRYAQHRDNYDKFNKSTFGLRLRENEISWGDISFSCIGTSPHLSSEKKLMEICERFIFLASDPLLSKK